MNGSTAQPTSQIFFAPDYGVFLIASGDGLTVDDEATDVIWHDNENSKLSPKPRNSRSEFHALGDGSVIEIVEVTDTSSDIANSTMKVWENPDTGGGGGGGGGLGGGGGRGGLGDPTGGGAGNAVGAVWNAAKHAGIWVFHHL